MHPDWNCSRYTHCTRTCSGFSVWVPWPLKCKGQRFWRRAYYSYSRKATKCMLVRMYVTTRNIQVWLHVQYTSTYTNVHVLITSPTKLLQHRSRFSHCIALGSGSYQEDGQSRYYFKKVTKQQGTDATALLKGIEFSSKHYTYTYTSHTRTRKIKRSVLDNVPTLMQRTTINVAIIV